MSDTKVYQFGETGNSSLNALLPFLQQRGIDPSYLYGLMGNNGFFGGNGIEGIIGLIVVLALIGGFNGNGNGLFGGNGNNNNGNNYAYDALLSAIQRNGTDISQLAQTVGVSSDRIHDAIGQVSTQICNLAAQNGQSALQIINSVQAGNASLATQIAECCCKTTQAITAQGYENQLATCQQTNTLVNTANANTLSLRDAATANTNAILGRLDAMEKATLYDKIDALREKNAQQAVMLNNAQQTAQFASMLAPITEDLASIKCKLPKTEVVNVQPDYIPVNRSVNIGYAPYYGCGYGAGFGFGSGYGWGGNCNNSLWG